MMKVFHEILLQVDGDGNLDAEKVIPYVKARKGYGQLFANKDDLIKRCVDFANSFSKGKFI